jgi:hypothetical protein
MGWRDTIQKDTQEALAPTPSWRDTIKPEAPIEAPSLETRALDKAKEFGRSTIENLPALGAMAGGTIGGVMGSGAAGIGAIPGSVAGAGLGGYAGEATKNLINTYMQPKQAPKGTEYLTQPLIAGGGAAAGELLGHGIGAGLGAAARTIGPKLTPVKEFISNKMGQGSDYLLKKTGKVLSNIPEEYTGEYLARKGELSPRSSEEIMDQISGIHGERAHAVEQAEKGVVRNKENVARVEQDLSERIADAKFKSGTEISRASDDYQNAARGVQEKLKGKSAAGLRDDVLESIDALKDKVTAGSADAYAILGDSQGSLSLGPALQTLDNGMNQLQIGGQAISDSAVSSLKNLSNLKGRLSELGGTITYPEVKGILQQLDKDIDYKGIAGEYYPEAQAVKRQVRQALDSVLKAKNPDYAKAMAGVSEDAGLLSELSKSFGTESKALGKLNQLSSDKGRLIDLPLLQKLGQKTGKDFTPSIDEYLGAQDVLGSPSKLKALKESTPEFKKLQDLEEKRSLLMDPASKRALEAQITSGAERQGLTEAEKKLAESEAAFEPVRKFGQGSVQAKMKALIGARNFDAKKLFSDLDQATGKKFSQEVKDRAIMDAFTKADTQGSRKTLFGTAAGSALGSPVAGASIGFTLDKYSGQVVKSLLDGKIAASKAREMLGKTMGKYAPAIVTAAQQGPHAMAVAGTILAKDPEFQKMIQRNAP